MKFAFTEEQQVFAETLSDVFAKRCPPEAVRACWDSPVGYPEELWRTLAEMGVLAITAPENAGGLGGDERDLVQLMEAAGRAAAPLPLLEHVAVGIPALAEAKGVAAKGAVAEGAEGAAASQHWLSQAISGEALVTAGVRDKGTVTDKNADSSTQIQYVNYADQADVAILSYQGELYLADRKDYTIYEQPSVDGTRRIARVEWSPDAAIRLAGVSASLAFDRGATAAAAYCVGLAQHLLDATVEYVKEREQFGKPVGSYQAVKHHLADVAKAISFARPSVYAAAWAVSQSASSQSASSQSAGSESITPENAVSDRAQYVSAAKSLASDAADLAAAKCLQCHGAIGYTFEHDLQLWLKRAWTTSVSWGSASQHRHRLATLLGL